MNLTKKEYYPKMWILVGLALAVGALAIYIMYGFFNFQSILF